MKNILFVIESLELGGAEKSLVTLLQNLEYSNYKVSLLLMQKEGVFKKFVPKNVAIIHHDMFGNVSPILKNIARIKFYLLRFFNKKHHIAGLFWKSFGKNIQNHHEEYDIAIAYNQGFSTYFVADKIKADKKYAWLNTDYVKAKYNIKFDFSKYKKFDQIVCVSKEAETSLKTSLNKINKKLPTCIIKDVIDKESVFKLSTKSDGFVPDSSFNTILTVARLVEIKGLDLAIKACQILKDKKIPFKWYIIGEGSKRNELQQLIDFHQLNDCMVLMGYKENPYPYMKTCDIYVQTSLFEGLGLTVIEATLLDKPIVCTNFPTAKTIITHKETGIICKMNPESIANAILEYINNPALVEKITSNLQQQVNNDKEKSLQAVSKLFKS